MWHKTIWMGHPMRLKLTCEGLLVQLANYYITRGVLDFHIYERKMPQKMGHVIVEFLLAE